MKNIEHSTQLDGHTIIRLKDACKMVGFSAKRVRTLEKEGKFPPRIQLGPKSVGFRLMDLRAWIDAKRQETIEELRTKIGMTGGEK